MWWWSIRVTKTLPWHSSIYLVGDNISDADNNDYEEECDDFGEPKKWLCKTLPWHPSIYSDADKEYVNRKPSAKTLHKPPSNGISFPSIGDNYLKPTSNIVCPQHSSHLVWVGSWLMQCCSLGFRRKCLTHFSHFRQCTEPSPPPTIYSLPKGNSWGQDSYIWFMDRWISEVGGFPKIMSHFVPIPRPCPAHPPNKTQPDFQFLFHCLASPYKIHKNAVLY